VSRTIKIRKKVL